MTSKTTPMIFDIFMVEVYRGYRKQATEQRHEVLPMPSSRPRAELTEDFPENCSAPRKHAHREGLSTVVRNEASDSDAHGKRGYAHLNRYDLFGSTERSRLVMFRSRPSN
jgi:hypothetical protein